MPYDANEKKVEQSAWNLSQDEVMKIASLRYRAQSNFLRGELQKCYWHTSEIRELIHTDLQKDEDDILDNLEQKIEIINNIRNVLKKQLDYLRDEEEDENIQEVEVLKKKFNKASTIHMNLIKKYRRRISEYLGKYGYLTTKKIDREDHIKF